MVYYYFRDDISDESLQAFCDFVNERMFDIKGRGLVVVLESDGGCANLITPFANLLNELCARVEIIRVYSAAFYIALMLDCPISLSLDATAMVHKAFTALQYPAPKGDKAYIQAKKSLQDVQKHLDGIAKLGLTDAQYKSFASGKELFFNAEEFSAILSRSRKARESGKMDKYQLVFEDLRPEIEDEDDADEYDHDGAECDN